MQHSGVLHSRTLLITGCGRSGTKYAAHVLQRLGLDVPHERLGRDGIASWYMAIEADRAPFGPTRGGLTFEHVLHQVRHPLAVIASATTFKRQSWEFICRHVAIRMQEPLLLRCAKYWYLWNLEAEKIAHGRYRVEDREAMLLQLRQRIRLPAGDGAGRQPAPNLNTRSLGWAFHCYQEICERLRLEPSAAVGRWLGRLRPAGPTALTWDMLHALDPELTQRIRSKAAQYGYAQ